MAVDGLREGRGKELAVTEEVVRSLVGVLQGLPFPVIHPHRP